MINYQKIILEIEKETKKEIENLKQNYSFEKAIALSRTFLKFLKENEEIKEASLKKKDNFYKNFKNFWTKKLKEIEEIIFINYLKKGNQYG